MKKMSDRDFKKYEYDPREMDKFIREKYDIPQNRYYTVSMFPEKFQGIIRIDNKRTRDPNSVFFCTCRYKFTLTTRVKRVYKWSLHFFIPKR